MKNKVSLSRSLMVLAIATVAVVSSGFEHPSVAARGSDQSHASAKSRGSDVFSSLEELDLSNEQSREIDAIRTNMTAQMAEILTPIQMDAFRQGREGGGDLRAVMRGLGLDSSQRSAVMALMRSTQDQIMSVLTPEQSAQIRGERPIDRK